MTIKSLICSFLDAQLHMHALFDNAICKRIHFFGSCVVGCELICMVVWSKILHILVIMFYSILIRSKVYFVYFVATRSKKEGIITTNSVILVGRQLL